LHLDRGTEPFFKPSFPLTREGVRDDTLSMRDIWEVSETHHELLFSRGRTRPRYKRANKGFVVFIFGFSTGEHRYDASKAGATIRICIAEVTALF